MMMDRSASSYPVSTRPQTGSARRESVTSPPTATGSSPYVSTGSAALRPSPPRDPLPGSTVTTASVRRSLGAAVSASRSKPEEMGSGAYTGGTGRSSGAFEAGSRAGVPMEAPRLTSPRDDLREQMSMRPTRDIPTLTGSVAGQVRDRSYVTPSPAAPPTLQRDARDSAGETYRFSTAATRSNTSTPHLSDDKSSTIPGLSARPSPPLNIKEYQPSAVDTGVTRFHSELNQDHQTIYSSPVPEHSGKGQDAARKWLNSATDVLQYRKTSQVSSTQHGSTFRNPPSTLPSNAASKPIESVNGRRGLKQVLAEFDSDEDTDMDVDRDLILTSASTPITTGQLKSPETRRTSSANLAEFKTPGAAGPTVTSVPSSFSRAPMSLTGETLQHQRGSREVSPPKVSIFDEDPVLDATEVTRSAAERKAERFLSVAGTVLTEDKILEQDPRALPSSNCRILLRSFRGSYLRKAMDSSRAITGGSPFDFESCEFIAEKHTSVPSKVIMYGDSLFLRLSGGEGKKPGHFLSGSEFTRESRGTWTIRRFVPVGSKTSEHAGKPQERELIASEEYVRSSDAIVLEYDSNRRVLGAPAIPHNADGAAYVSLEISPLEQSQCWQIVRCIGLATSFVPSAALPPIAVLSEELAAGQSLSGTQYLLETLMGIYTPNTSVERMIESDEDILLLERCEPILEHVTFLREYVRTRTQMEWGRVVQALCFHLSEKVLDPFDEFLAELLASSPSSMTFLVNAVQPRCRIVVDWARALKPVQFLRGGMLLNALNAMKLGAFEHRTSCDEALQSAMRPYYESLERWVLRGEIFDPFEEFLVVENPKLTERQLVTDYNARFWNSKFVLREEKYIPWFLRRNAEMVLRSGRDLQASRAKANTKQLVPTAALSKAFILLSGKPLQQSQLDHVLSECHKRASSELLQVLRDSELFPRLEFLKRFFLLERGDFFLHFMDVAGDELRKTCVQQQRRAATGTTISTLMKIPESQQHRLETLLQVAMRERDTRYDSFLDELSCVVLPYAVDTHVETIHRLSQQSTDDEFNESEIVGIEDVLLNVDAFALEYLPPWPISLVLSKRVMTKYQLLFRHLFRCKHAERRICATWLAIRRSGVNDPVAQNLILRMTHFLQSLEYYTAFEVVEPGWRDFMQKGTKAEDVDELLRAHEDFLDSCLRECLLTNPTLIRGLSRLLRLCLSLGDLLLQDEQEDIAIPVRCDPIRVSEFDQELCQFLGSLYQEAEKGQFKTEHLHNLAIRLDFSEFYGVIG